LQRVKEPNIQSWTESIIHMLDRKPTLET